MPSLVNMALRGAKRGSNRRYLEPRTLTTEVPLAVAIDRLEQELSATAALRDQLLAEAKAVVDKKTRQRMNREASKRLGEYIYETVRTSPTTLEVVCKPQFVKSPWKARITLSERADTT